MKEVRFLLLIILLLLVCCRKSANSGNTVYKGSDSLSIDALNELVSFPVDTNLNFANLTFSDHTNVDSFLRINDSGFYTQNPAYKTSKTTALSVFDVRKLLIAKMTKIGVRLCERSFFTYPDEGSNAPAQNGLAYVWGSKSFKNRSVGSCTEMLYGLDCSGFIYVAATSAGLNFSTTVPDSKYFSDPNNWTNALKHYYPWLYATLYSNPDPAQIITGDIIIWLDEKGNPAHCGLAVGNGNNGKLPIANSHGSRDSCYENKQLNYGPVIQDFPSMAATKHYQNYWVIRFMCNTFYGLHVGDNYGGGVVGYILQEGDPGYDPGQQHGLIAALADQSGPMQWWDGDPTDSSVIMPATSTVLGYGRSNTYNVINVLGSGTAAYLCATYNGGGYSDWYLPSQDELNKLYLNQALIGNFASYVYWSSSCNKPFGQLCAGCQSFTYGTIFDYLTTYSNRVRAVRSF